jgi:hypothetical protein
MHSVVPVSILNIYQSQICLVDERCGLECVTGPLIPHVAPGNAVKFCIDQRHQAVECRLVAATPGLQQNADFDGLRRFTRG